MRQIRKRIQYLCNNIRKEEKGSATIEGAIWIPFIFIAVLMVLKILLQWTELGIVQGEMLCHTVSDINYEKSIEHKKEMNKISIQDLQFLQNPVWTQEIKDRHYIVNFKAGQLEPLKPYIEQEICIKMENPIQVIRRRERLENISQEIGLP